MLCTRRPLSVLNQKPEVECFSQSIAFLCWAVVCKVVLNLLLVTESTLYNKDMGFGMEEGMVGLWKSRMGRELEISV